MVPLWRMPGPVGPTCPATYKKPYSLSTDLTLIFPLGLLTSVVSSRYFYLLYIFLSVYSDLFFLSLTQPGLWTSGPLKMLSNKPWDDTMESYSLRPHSQSTLIIPKTLLATGSTKNPFIRRPVCMPIASWKWQSNQKGYGSLVGVTG